MELLIQLGISNIEKCPINYIKFLNKETLNKTMQNLNTLNITFNLIDLDSKELLVKNGTNYDFINNTSNDFLLYTNRYTQGRLINDLSIRYLEPCLLSNQILFPTSFQKFPFKKGKFNSCLTSKKDGMYSYYTKSDSTNLENLLNRKSSKFHMMML